MEIPKTEENFDKAVNSVSKHLKILLLAVDESIKRDCCEVRLRRNMPVVLVLKNRSLFLHIDGTVGIISEKAFICSDEILSDTFSRMCGFSLHSHLSDITNGFVTLEGGHRAGVVGTAALDKNGDIVSVRDISSINIRIAREIDGCSEELHQRLFKNGLQSIIIAGPPACGKTTILRDLIKKVSDSGVKVSVIDERQEIASLTKKGNQMNLGINTDVFSGYPKRKALNIAVRTMSPQVIVIDEVCENEEIEAISLASNCGVKMIVTIHAASYKELLNKPQIYSLINTYAFDKLVLLMGSDKPGKISGIFDIRELRDEILRRRIGLAESLDDRLDAFSSA